MNPPDPRISYFNQLAPVWDRVGPDPARTLERLDDLREQLAFQPGSRLLEVGCGSGQISGWLLDQVRPGEVIAIDFSEAMLNEARGRQLDVRFLQHDICAAPPDTGPGSFDVILCFHVFPHFRDQPAALRHLASVLAPAGRLLVMHLSGSEPLNAFHASLEAPVRHDRLPPPGGWPSLLAQARLRLASLVDQPDLFLLGARHEH